METKKNEIIKYDINAINEVLNIVNTLEFKGFESAHKLSRIFALLNNPLKEDLKEDI